MKVRVDAVSASGSSPEIQCSTPGIVPPRTSSAASLSMWSGLSPQRLPPRARTGICSRAGGRLATGPGRSRLLLGAMRAPLAGHRVRRGACVVRDVVVEVERRRRARDRTLPALVRRLRGRSPRRLPTSRLRRFSPHRERLQPLVRGWPVIIAVDARGESDSPRGRLPNPSLNVPGARSGGDNRIRRLHARRSRRDHDRRTAEPRACSSPEHPSRRVNTLLRTGRRGRRCAGRRHRPYQPPHPRFFAAGEIRLRHPSRSQGETCGD